MKFEYEKKYCALGKELDLMNDMGKKGWEFCSTYDGAFYFKRAIEVKNLAQPDVSGEFSLRSETECLPT